METILLSKKDCPQCENLKRTLNGSPKLKANLDKVTMVHEVDTPEEYIRLTEEYGIMSMPSMIHNGEVVPMARIPQIIATL